MNKHLICLLAGCFAAPASAQSIKVKPLLDLRLRYENVDQDRFLREADAVTLRVRAGAEFSTGPWRLLAEGEGTAAPVEHYDSGVNGKTFYPLVADPKSAEVNRLQLQYTGFKKSVVTLGRQRINLDDQRFVGAAGWRQNEQTFDAIRLETGDAKGFKADLTYAWSVRTIWGRHAHTARQQAVDGDNVFLNVSHPTPVGTLTAFDYVVDQDESIVSLFRQSSNTLGARLAGAHKLSPKAKLTYALSYATQKDHGKNPNDYRADYKLAEVGVELAAAKLGLGYEVLGADDGRPFTSFQTPLATLHKFQGWADKFLTTPPNGVRDKYASAGYGWKKVFGLDAINAVGVYHRFDSDRLDLHYGNEWNASVAAKKGRWTVTAKVADYQADRFATDTRKAWLQLEWIY
ncbi:MAG: alginate export family protein [Sphingomicrobium sp.]